LPVPKPNEGESEDEFISRCISTLTEEDPDRPKDQIAAMCYDSWRDNSKNAKSLYDKLVGRFGKIRQILIETFGERGRLILDYTLVRLGVYDPKMQKMNFAALKGDLPLPFLKYDGEVAVVGNLIFGETEFMKIDKEKHTVSGYANTMTADTYDDLWLPDAYKDSVSEYGIDIHFMHHKDVKAGVILQSEIDQIGWKVDTKPLDGFWPLFENGTLKGFSIGGWIKIWPDEVGRTWVAHKRFSLFLDDLSYVTRPANRLSYFDDLIFDEKEKLALHALINNPTRPIRHKNLLRLLKSTSQSQDMTLEVDGAETSTLSGSGLQSTTVSINPQQTKEEKKMSEGDDKEKDKIVQSNEPKTPFEIMKEKLATAKPEEFNDIYREYLKTQAAEEVKRELLDDAAKIEQDKIELATSQLPKRVDRLEAKVEESIKELTTKMDAVMVKIDEIQSAPALKSATRDGAPLTPADKALKVFRELGKTDIAWEAAERELEVLKKEAGIQ